MGATDPNLSRRVLWVLLAFQLLAFWAGGSLIWELSSLVEQETLSARNFATPRLRFILAAQSSIRSLQIRMQNKDSVKLNELNPQIKVLKRMFVEDQEHHLLLLEMQRFEKELMEKSWQEAEKTLAKMQDILMVRAGLPLGSVERSLMRMVDTSRELKQLGLLWLAIQAILGGAGLYFFSRFQRAEALKQQGSVLEALANMQKVQSGRLDYFRGLALKQDQDLLVLDEDGLIVSAYRGHEEQDEWLGRMLRDVIQPADASGFPMLSRIEKEAGPIWCLARFIKEPEKVRTACFELSEVGTLSVTLGTRLDFLEIAPDLARLEECQEELGRKIASLEPGILKGDLQKTLEDFTAFRQRFRPYQSLSSPKPPEGQ